MKEQMAHAMYKLTALMRLSADLMRLKSGLFEKLVVLVMFFAGSWGPRVPQEYEHWRPFHVFTHLTSFG